MSKQEQSIEQIEQSDSIMDIIKWLRISWLAWLGLMIVIYPLMIATLTPLSFGTGMLAQALGLIVPVLCTPFIWRGKSPYALIVISLVTLVFLGITAVRLFFDAMQGLPFAVLAVDAIELVLVFAINVLLFLLLKRLPAMHKTTPNPNP